MSLHYLEKREPQKLSFRECWIFADTIYVIRSKQNFAWWLVFRRWFCGSNYVKTACGFWAVGVEICPFPLIWPFSHWFIQFDGKEQTLTPHSSETANRLNSFGEIRTSELPPE